MSIKLLGAVLIILSCGGVGYKICLAHKQEVAALRQLVAALDYMGCELQYRVTPLPELCRETAGACSGPVGKLWLNLAGELEGQVLPNAKACMVSAVASTKGLPDKTKAQLLHLGASLGHFDLKGQLQGIEWARQRCRKELESLTKDQSARLRSYQTLALCAGAALAIIFV